jgi:NhaC family Na+:H+ antiporter
VIFLVLGFTITPASSTSGTTEMLNAIDEKFYVNPILLLVPVVLIIIIIKKMPPIPALFIGTIIGALAALVFQGGLLHKMAAEDHSFFEAAYMIIMQSMFGSIEIHSGNEAISQLLSTGGMAGILDTIWLILMAMAFSGVMESAGMLVRIAESIIKFAKSTGSLVASTVATSIFMNITASEQYISIVVPGRMYADIYKKQGLKPEVLSRTLEDGGTVTSVLIPWNTCGAVQSSVLGVPTLMYAPYVFFSIISPFMTIAFAYLNIKIRRFSDDVKKKA